jgi:hypothetical protein
MESIADKLIKLNDELKEECGEKINAASLASFYRFIAFLDRIGVSSDNIYEVQLSLDPENNIYASWNLGYGRRVRNSFRFLKDSIRSVCINNDFAG